MSLLRSRNGILKMYNAHHWNMESRAAIRDNHSITSFLNRIRLAGSQWTLYKKGTLFSITVSRRTARAGRKAVSPRTEVIPSGIPSLGGKC